MHDFLLTENLFPSINTDNWELIISAKISYRNKNYIWIYISILLDAHINIKIYGCTRKRFHKLVRLHYNNHKNCIRGAETEKNTIAYTLKESA